MQLALIHFSLSRNANELRAKKSIKRKEKKEKNPDEEKKPWWIFTCDLKHSTAGDRRSWTKPSVMHFVVFDSLCIYCFYVALHTHRDFTNSICVCTGRSVMFYSLSHRFYVCCESCRFSFMLCSKHVVISYSHISKHRESESPVFSMPFRCTWIFNEKQ